MSSKKTSGLFITFEGTEGAGKSTLIREVASRLQSPECGNHSVVITREPGGSGVAEKIREVILGHGMDPWTELFLYEAARAEHLARTVLPAFTAGQIILCDRFTDSSLAYQAHARGLPWKDVEKLNQAATRGFKPSMTVLLDIDPSVGLARAKDPNRFEEEGVAFQRKVRQGFLKARREDPKRWFTLSVGDSTPAELAEAVIKELFKRYPRFFAGKKK